MLRHEKLVEDSDSKRLDLDSGKSKTITWSHHCWRPVLVNLGI